MLLASRHEGVKTANVLQGEGRMPSHGMEWLWQQLRDVRRPQILDCGPLRQTTLDILLRRGVKLCVADLVSPLQRGNPKFWDKSKKVPMFLTDVLLEQVPSVTAGTQDAVLLWHLLDLIPPEAVPPTVERAFSYLKPGGILFAGGTGPTTTNTLTGPDADTDWIIDGPTEQFVASIVYSHDLLFVTGGFPEHHVLTIRPARQACMRM